MRGCRAQAVRSSSQTFMEDISIGSRGRSGLLVPVVRFAMFIIKGKEAKQNDISSSVKAMFNREFVTQLCVPAHCIDVHQNPQSGLEAILGCPRYSTWTIRGAATIAPLSRYQYNPNAARLEHKTACYISIYKAVLASSLGACI